MTSFLSILIHLSFVAHAQSAVTTPINACPTPHFDCTSACGTRCTFWSCEDHTTIPITITSLPLSFIRAKPQCRERLETVLLKEIPLPPSQQSLVVGPVHQLPLDFRANSYACVPHEKYAGDCPWTVGSWSSCSTTCGPGVQTRSVTCSGAYCDPGSRPPDTQACNPGFCLWSEGPWSSCSAPCGGGTQSRTVTCAGPENSCNPSTRPATNQACNTLQCAVNCTVATKIFRPHPCGYEELPRIFSEDGSGCGAFVDQTRTIPHGGSLELFLTESYTQRGCGMGLFPRMASFGGHRSQVRNCANGVLTGSIAAVYENSILNCWEPGGSPLMVHFNDSAENPVPLEFTNPVDGINFNLLGFNSKPQPHTPVRISWYKSSQYYFIALPNAKGEVLGVDQLFGDNTLGPDGTFAQDGYFALAKYDGKTADGLKPFGQPDGYITVEDPVFEKLRLWHDDNFDGKAQPSELRPMEDLGVDLIDLAADPNFRETDRYGNETTLKSVVRTKDQRYHVLFDVWFKYYDLELFNRMKSNPKNFLKGSP